MFISEQDYAVFFESIEHFIQWLRGEFKTNADDDIFLEVELDSSIKVCVRGKKVGTLS